MGVILLTWYVLIGHANWPNQAKTRFCTIRNGFKLFQTNINENRTCLPEQIWKPRHEVQVKYDRVFNYRERSIAIKKKDYSPPQV